VRFRISAAAGITAAPGYAAVRAGDRGCFFVSSRPQRNSACFTPARDVFLHPLVRPAHPIPQELGRGWRRAFCASGARPDRSVDGKDFVAAHRCISRSESTYTPHPIPFIRRPAPRFIVNATHLFRISPLQKRSQRGRVCFSGDQRSAGISWQMFAPPTGSSNRCPARSSATSDKMPGRSACNRRAPDGRCRPRQRYRTNANRHGHTLKQLLIRAFDRPEGRGRKACCLGKQAKGRAGAHSPALMSND